MKTTVLCENEIRDYINRAPARCAFDGHGIVWNTHARMKWLTELCRGSIHERINRRAGIVDVYEPWKASPTQKSMRRNRCNENRKHGIWQVNHW